MAKFNSAARGTFRGLIWLVVLAVALSISAYSLFYVARILGVPKLFAAGFSTAYDGVALIAADKSLQFAKEGRSGAFPRLVMVLFAGLSAFLNSLHAIFGHENPLAIPMWAGLPLAAVAAFEIHTSGERARANARFGYGYPAPLPKYGGWGWGLFFLETLGSVRTVVRARIRAITAANQPVVAVNERRTPAPRPIERPVPAPERTNDDQPAERTNDASQPEQPVPERPVKPAGNGTVTPIGRARHAPERHIRDWAKAKGYKVAERGALPGWMKEEYAREGTNDEKEAVNDT